MYIENVLQIIFRLALPRQLCRIVIVRHRRQYFVLSITILLASWRPISIRRATSRRSWSPTLRCCRRRRYRLCTWQAEALSQECRLCFLGRGRVCCWRGGRPCGSL